MIILVKKVGRFIFFDTKILYKRTATMIDFGMLWFWNKYVKAIYGILGFPAILLDIYTNINYFSNVQINIISLADLLYFYIMA